MFYIFGKETKVVNDISGYGTDNSGNIINIGSACGSRCAAEICERTPFVPALSNRAHRSWLRTHLQAKDSDGAANASRVDCCIPSLLTYEAVAVN